MREILVFGLLSSILVCLPVVLCAPVDPNKPSENEINENVIEVKDDAKVDTEIDDLGLEYGRYLQEVVKALDEDPQFSKKLENITHEQIMNGEVARQIQTVGADVRSRLDELKRIELDRLRKLAMKEHKLEEEMEHDDNAAHLDHGNPHTFEAEDLQKLILQATKDLDELDRKRRRDFKQYEMEKEITYRETLKNMTVDQRVEAERKHEQQKHKEHPKVHHPGSKQQFEQVWQEQDHMPRQEFDPKVFFQMHDLNGDGFLDQEEVEALLSIEVRKLYNEKDPNFDRNEMIEEYHRMREHIYKEIDSNKDGLISKKEFLDYTKQDQFTNDDGWKGIDEAPVYTEEELKRYEQERIALQNHYAKYGAYQMPYQPGMEYAYQPVYYQEQHPGQQMHPQQQQVQYVHVNAPPEHIQQPVQYQHVQLPPQHYQQQVPQQGYQPSQGQYQALPPPSQQQQHPGQPNPNVAQLPPAQQQQQQQQQQMHPQQGYNQVPQQQMSPPGQQGYQQHPVQGQAAPQQYHQQVPQQQYQQQQPPPPPQGQAVPQQYHQQVPQQQQQYHQAATGQHPPPANQKTH